MALTIDGAAVLRAIAEHPDAFPAVKSDLEELARKLLVKQLKAKMTDDVLLQRICKVAKEDSVKTVLDSFSANDLAGLVKRIDPHSGFGKAAADLQPVRLHIVGIASGRIPLSPEPEKPSKPAPKAKKTPARLGVPKIGIVLESKVHSGKARASRSKKPT